MIRAREAGERALLLEVDDNASARRVAHAVRSLEGLVDVVPAHRTVLVTGSLDRQELLAAAQAALERAAIGEAGRRVEIPVAYSGPDLDDVAGLAGLSPEEVVARHVGADYVVGFLGFAPGFAYLLGGDERLRVPRLDAPRARVPAGSVAVAGPYTGIYPRASPGGWRLLGRTSMTLFDAVRDPPSLLAAGDRVRFVAT
jgi:KipI family sensor histidine kinase inhibitor